MAYFELKSKKQMVGFIIVAILVFIIDRLYSLFSHGVGSWAMSTMVVTVGVLGIFGYGVMGSLIQKRLANRQVDWFIRLYNSGIATAVVGQFLSGVMEIAGTGSPYIKLYYIVAMMLFLCGFSLLVVKRESIDIRGK